MPNVHSLQPLICKMKVGEAIGHYFDIDPGVLYVPGQKHDVAHMRFIAYYLLHNHYNLNARQIGTLYHKDRTTILAGLKRVPKLNLMTDATNIVIHYLSA